MAGPDKVVAKVSDGTSMRLPRGWTDIDGAPSSVTFVGVERVFSVDAMLALIELVEVLGHRA